MRRRALALALACALEALAPFAPATASAGATAEAGSTVSDVPAPLELSINGAHGPVSFVLSRQGDVLVPAADLAHAAVVLPAKAVTLDVAGIDYVSLRSLAPKITYTVDDDALAIDLTVPAGDFATQNVSLGSQRAPAANAVTSGFFNYDLSAGLANGAPGDSSAYEAFGASGDAGVASTSFDQSIFGLTRGLTNFVHENQPRLVRDTFGDLEADGGPLGSDVVLGGIGVARAFDVQPSFLRYPSAGISGTVLQPESADVYVNGAYVKTVQLQPGAFTISNLQIPTGAADATVVLHDPSGATTTVQSASYVGADLLRAGLTDYEYDLGFTRPNPFGRNDYYGPLAAIGRYRIGLSNDVTAGARFEAEPGLASGGPHLDFGTRFGTFAFYEALSNARGIAGNASAAAYTYAGRGLTAQVSATHYSPTYADVQLSAAQDRRLSEVDESLVLPVTRSATLQVENSSVVDRDLGRSRIWSSDLRVGLSPRTNLDLTASESRAPQTAWTIGSSLMFYLGNRSDLTLSAQAAGSEHTSGALLEQAVPQQAGFGYRLEADDGTGGTLVNGYATDRTNVGDATVTLQDAAGSSSAQFSLAGALTIFGQGIVASRPLDGPYALADVAGLAHAPVDLNGAYAGTTDGRGLLVVPELTPYAANTIALGSLDAYADLDPVVDEQTVVPRNRSAVVAELSVRHVRIYRGTVTIAHAGTPVVPAFGRLRLSLGALTFDSDIGTGGEFSFENLLPATYAATIASDEGTCSFSLTIAPDDRMLTELGPLSCTP